MDFPALIAHRGLHDGNIPENSLSAFKKAADMGFGIELDVHLTKDGKLVVFHDGNLKRMTGVDALIEDFTYEQLTALRLKETDERIPLLSEVLKLVNGRVMILVEIKEGSGVGILEKRLNALMKGYKGEWAVMSFNPLRVLWFYKNAPSVSRGQLISDFKAKGEKIGLKYIEKYIASKKIVWKNFSKPDFIAADLRSVSLDMMIDAFENGCAFLSWTAKTEETLKEALKFSRSVIFENIDAQKALEISL